MAGLDGSEHQSYAQLRRGRHGLAFGNSSQWPDTLGQGKDRVGRGPDSLGRKETKMSREAIGTKSPGNPQSAALGNLLVGVRVPAGVQQVLAGKWYGSFVRIWKLFKNPYIIKVIPPTFLNFYSLHNHV